MTAGYTFAVTCPQCGGEVDHVASGVVHGGTEAGVGVSLRPVPSPVACAGYYSLRTRCWLNGWRGTG